MKAAANFSPLSSSPPLDTLLLCGLFLRANSYGVELCVDFWPPYYGGLDVIQV